MSTEREKRIEKVAAGPTRTRIRRAILAVMADKSWRTFGVRASDLEREDAAHRIEAANGEGRLSLAEAEQRLALAYSATYRYELRRLVEDLPSRHAPAPDPESRNAKVRLDVHAIVVAGLAGFLLYRWMTSGSEASSGGRIRMRRLPQRWATTPPGTCSPGGGEAVMTRSAP